MDNYFIKANSNNPTQPFDMSIKSKEPKIYYTEDNFPIHTLYVSQFHPKTTECTLHEYFSKYGTVESVRLCKTPKSFTYAFVYFEKPESAAKALLQKEHNMQKRRMRVLGADSWHQVKRNKLNSKEIEERKSENEEPNDAVSIQILNDDCLLHIFSYLNVLDMQPVQLTCTRFQYLAEICYKKYKVFNFEEIDKMLTLMETRTILSMVGPMVTELNVPAMMFFKSNRRIIELIPRYCKNLRKLRLEGFTITMVTIKRFRQIFEQLESLELVNCGIIEQIDKFLETAKNLKTLNLTKNSEISGKCLSKCTNLLTLNLDNCVNLQAKFFSNYCQNNKSLKYLNINGCDRLNDKNINDMVTNLENLEHLVISNIYESILPQEMSRFAELKNLKKLQIIFTSFSHVDELFIELSKRDQLEYLDIAYDSLTTDVFKYLKDFNKLKVLKFDYKSNLDDEHLNYLENKPSIEELHLIGCQRISNDGLIFIIKNCPNLNFLDISGCGKVTSEFLTISNNYLKEQSEKFSLLAASNYNRKITIIVGHTSINMECLVTDVTINENFNIKNISNYEPQLIDLELFDDLWGIEDDLDDLDDDDDDDDIYLDSDEDDDDFFLGNEDFFECGYGCNPFISPFQDDGSFDYFTYRAFFKDD